MRVDILCSRNCFKIKLSVEWLKGNSITKTMQIKLIPVHPRKRRRTLVSFLIILIHANLRLGSSTAGQDSKEEQNEEVISLKLSSSALGRRSLRPRKAADGAEASGGVGGATSADAAPATSEDLEAITKGGQKAQARSMAPRCERTCVVFPPSLPIISNTTIGQ